MLTLLLTLASMTPAPATPLAASAPAAQTQGTAGQAGPPSLVTRSSRASTFATQVKGTLWNSTGGGPQVMLLGRLDGNVYVLRMTGTGTGWDEDFLIGIPPYPLAPAPLLGRKGRDVKGKADVGRAEAARGPTPPRKRCGERTGSRSQLSRCYRDRAIASGQILGAARREEPRATLEATRQEGRGAGSPSAHLRLVHRRLRHAGSEGCKGTAQ